MLMLLAIIERVQLYIQRFMHWFSTPSRLRRSYKHPHFTNGNNQHHSVKKPEWLKGEIIRLKALMPQAGCRSIADICNRRFAASRKVTVGKTYVHQVLQRHGYEIQILHRNLKHAKPKNIPHNLIWGIDLTGKTDTHKNLHALFGILDPGACPELSRRSSRALLHLQALRDKTSRTLIACISKFIRTYGKPKIIRTDNEACPKPVEVAIFTSKQFCLGLKRLGIRHQRTDPGCPWQNGRIERLFGTLKQKLDQHIYFPLPSGLRKGRCVAAGHPPAYSLRVKGLRVGAQLNRNLNIFRHWYNHIRPHQNLSGKTPAEAWSDDDPYTKSPKKEYWFEAWDGLLTGYHLRY